MSDFSTPPWEETDKNLCEDCGGIVRDGFCEDCGMEQPDRELSDLEYLRDND